MADPDKLAAVGLIFLFLGGSFLAVVWVIDQTLLPVAALVYILVGVALVRRVRQARNVA